MQPAPAAAANGQQDVQSLAVESVKTLVQQRGGVVDLNTLKLEIFRNYQRAEASVRNGVVALVQDPNWLNQVGFACDGTNVGFRQQ